MALYHKWDAKTGFAVVLQFFLLISDGLGGVQYHAVFVRTTKTSRKNAIERYISHTYVFYVKI